MHFCQNNDLYNCTKIAPDFLSCTLLTYGIQWSWSPIEQSTLGHFYLWLAQSFTVECPVHLGIHQHPAVAQGCVKSLWVLRCDIPVTQFFTPRR